MMELEGIKLSFPEKEDPFIMEDLAKTLKDLQHDDITHQDETHCDDALVEEINPLFFNDEISY